MSHPCPDDPTPDRPRKHQQNAQPGSRIVVFTIQSDIEPCCTGDALAETIEYDSLGNRIDGEAYIPFEHPEEAISYFSCGNHRDPTVGLWINDDGTSSPPPPEPS
jgi:hypothetical protein